MPVSEAFIRKYRLDGEALAEVGEIKRFLECWTADPKVVAAYAADPAAALSALGSPLTPSHVTPLVDRSEATRLTARIAAADVADYPASLLAYRRFIAAKLDHRRVVRTSSRSDNYQLSVWRSRQVNRCITELGITRSDSLVHAPVSIELSKGCTVGCWFCGVSASRFESYLPYTAVNRTMWRDMLQILRETIGPSVRNGFLYWATDPFDNPDYERFLIDFNEMTGRCPQTTTALALKDIGRTRELLALGESLNADIDRFSVLTLDSLKRIHQAFGAEELLRVECITQNREAVHSQVKANAGRARQFAQKRPSEVAPAEKPSTIACVSGFLINLPDKTVKLITPCNASERWPLGYMTLAFKRFATVAEFRTVLLEMIAGLKISPTLDDVVSFRKDVTCVQDGNSVVARTPYATVTMHDQPGTEPAIDRIRETDGVRLRELVLWMRDHQGIAFERAFHFVNELFHNGLLQESHA